ncbi:glycosyltransferase family 2 protein [Dyadobacter sp. LHD-138]|uniref:glycosyltransferase family 2 protein n=1 Tax=Dyadobacter sp. LHD-138 TaxID=3071413 RepID=UPI0027E09520|nr:glycosyltransferase family 2 protein [Dyadobacter sp. LHD-138]MDQ6481884.1 glycosyltransferase family 2 protein [Dyadobacter sp. LHD-138]
MSKTAPLISIITATYNAGETLSVTIESLKKQSFKDFEYIIIDGGSTDNTSDIIFNNYPGLIDIYLSEPDNGIYDAWNKGLKLANGEWISFIGAGDSYLPDALENYAANIKNQLPHIEFLSSRVNVISSQGENLFVIGKSWEWPEFLNRMTTAHVGALHSKRFFEKYGIFDISYKIAGDYELLMRPKENLKAAFIPLKTANMLYGGVSQSFSILKEDMRLKINTAEVPIAIAILEFFVSFLKMIIRKISNSLHIYRSVKS